MTIITDTEWPINSMLRQNLNAVCILYGIIFSCSSNLNAFLKLIKTTSLIHNFFLALLTLLLVMSIAMGSSLEFIYF